ncbi:MAG: PucR family transcriptional regulator [Pseudomonadota bacterium]
MTTVITRYFDSAAQAAAVRFELVNRRRFSVKILRLYDAAEGAEEKLVAADVDAQTAREYQNRLANGGAVLMVRAGYKPLGVAKTFRTLADEMGAADLGNILEETSVKDETESKLSVLDGQPLMLSRPRDPYSTNFHQADWPIGLINRRQPFTDSIFPRHARMASWPAPLLFRDFDGNRYQPYTDSIFPRHARMASWPIGHLVSGKRRYGRFPFGLLVPHRRRYGRFPFGFLVPHERRYGRFPFDFLVPGHRRMANWPFPLLINGKQHTNSLVPGSKYMAKFPFAHIVPGHKYYANVPIGHSVSHNRRYGRFPFGLLVPGQRFMAKFPFSHIVPGHKHYAKFPFDHIVPGHKYMANWIWPHTKTKSD